MTFDDLSPADAEAQAMAALERLLRHAPDNGVGADEAVADFDTIVNVIKVFRLEYNILSNKIGI